MKKYLLSAFFAMALLLPWLSNAQSNCDKLRDYKVAAGATGYTSITTLPGYADSAVAYSSGIAQLNMPFSMVLGSQVINQGDPIYISTNGFVSLSRPTAYNAMPSTRVIAPLATTGSDNFSTGALNLYKVYDATAGAESLTIEWSNAGLNGSTFNFQVILTKADNGIEFVYDVPTGTTTAARTFSFAKRILAGTNEYLNFKDNTGTIATDTTYTSTQYLVLAAAANAAPVAPVDVKAELTFRKPCQVWASNITASTVNLHWTNVDASQYRYIIVEESDSAAFFDGIANWDSYSTLATACPSNIQATVVGIDSAAVAALNPYTKYFFAVAGYKSGVGRGQWSPIGSFTTDMITLYMNNSANAAAVPPTQYVHTPNTYAIEHCGPFAIPATNPIAFYDATPTTYAAGSISLDQVMDANGNVVTSISATDTTSYYVIVDATTNAPAVDYYKILLEVKINVPVLASNTTEVVCDEYPVWPITKADGTFAGVIDSAHSTTPSGTDGYVYSKIDTLLIAETTDPFYAPGDCEMHILHLTVMNSTTKTIDTTVCSLFELPIVGTYWGNPVNTVWKMGVDADASGDEMRDPYMVVAPAALTNLPVYTYQNNDESTYDPSTPLTLAGQPLQYMLNNAVGCDSIIVVNLILKPAQDEQKWDTVIAFCNATGRYTYNGKLIDGSAATATEDYPVNAGVATNGCEKLHWMRVMVGKPVLAATYVETGCGEYTWKTDATIPMVGNGVTYGQLDADAPSNALYRDLTNGVYVTNNPIYLEKDANNNITPGYTYPIDGAGIGAVAFVPDNLYELNLTLLEAVYSDDTIVTFMTSAMNPWMLAPAPDYLGLDPMTGNPAIMLPANALAPSFPNVSLPMDETFLQQGKGMQLGDAINIDTTARYYDPAVIAAGTTPTGFCDSIVRYHLSIVYNYENILDTVCMSAQGTVIVKDLSVTYTASSTTNTGIINFWVPNTLEPTRDTTFIIEQAGGTVGPIFNQGTPNERGYNLELTVIKNVYSYDTVEACGSYTWNGVTYTTTQVPNVKKTFQRPVEQGCDSVAVLLLTIQPAGSTVAQTINESACNTYTWDVDGNTYTNDTVVTGTPYTDSMTHCIVLPTLNLHIATAGTATDVVTACDAYVWRDSIRYTASTTTPTYSRHNTTTGDCDSVFTLNLTINYSSYDTINDIVCRGTAYNNNGFNIPASVFNTRDFYTTFLYDPASLPNGCNQIHVLNLTVGQRLSVNVTEEACDSYTWNGTTYNRDVTLVENGTSVMGCDSITTINVIITRSTHDTTTALSCGPYTWSLNNINYGTSGNYVVFDTVDPCVNTHTLILTVEGGFSSSADTVCGSFVWKGVTYTNSATVTDTVATANGCDSIVAIAYTVRNAYVIGGEAIIECGSYTWPHNGVTYTATTNVNDDPTGNCDTVYVLNLTINPVYNHSFDVKACESYLWMDSTITDGGTYTATLTSVNGCDSIVTLNLALGLPTDTTIDVPAACEVVVYDGEVFTVSTTRTNNYTTEYGCDSTITLNIVVNHRYISVTDTVVWAPIDWRGEQRWSTDMYFDTVFADSTLGTCDSIFILNLENMNGINNAEQDNVNVYPNPTTGVINISGAEVTRVEVLDLVGRMVARFDNTSRIDLNRLSAGAYTLRITTTEGMMLRRVVKK
ncbi:MAG: T9SS type A sorting domain-containing protein [Bacteroidales bacterium]|nr:T9SS type A sorting domain-containing protein [Bacteroidales bacterium]